MTADAASLDAHEQPSDHMRATWKNWSRAEKDHVLKSAEVDDLSNPEKAAEFCIAGNISPEKLAKALHHLGCTDTLAQEHDSPVYYHPLLPGLLIAPSLVPPDAQKVLLDRLIHQHLSDPQHQTNLHLHYDLPYPQDPSSEDGSASFFSYPPDSPATFRPKEPGVHKPLSVRQVMERRLHWVTLGGQYNWTDRLYPESPPPAFPPDLAGFLDALFPDTRAQAAIVNFYTPGDTMMMHRDVSEESAKGLVSLSLGCDCLFMVSPNDVGKLSREELEAADGRHHLLLRLRSGDVIYMSKESRYAWHGVPKVLKGTCPDYLEDWPAQDGSRFEPWRGWMKNKRINLNVRQMTD